MTGPVQVLVVGFDEPNFSGQVLAELTRLREAGVVRLIDVLLVSRGAEGTFETCPLPRQRAWRWVASWPRSWVGRETETQTPSRATRGPSRKLFLPDPRAPSH